VFGQLEDLLDTLFMPKVLKVQTANRRWCKYDCSWHMTWVAHLVEKERGDSGL